jgi:hypothetical protein
MKMSDAAVQKGTTLKIAFGSFEYTGYVPEDGLTWKKPAGNVVEITDTNGAMMTKIIMDPRDEFSMSLIILDTGDITPPIQGATITITDPDGDSIACMVNDATVTFAREHTRLSLDLVKEGSMTYS